MSIIRILLVVLSMLSILMLAPFFMALILGESQMMFAFLLPILIGGIPGILIKYIFRKKTLTIRPKDGFLLVFLTWAFGTLLGSLCYYLSPANMNLPTAIFESACGFSTTGATTINDLDIMPRSLLFWRSISHWAGGMGIILLFVALLTLLGISNFQLIKAEVPGPEKERLRPRITDTAKVIWGVYCIFTAVLIILYNLGGMSLYDSVCHAFTIISTGGVSVKNDGFASYNSAFIDWVTIIFMLLGAINFSLYYRLIRGRITDFIHNTEVRIFLLIFLISAIIISINIIPNYLSVTQAFRYGFFQAVSILTTTGNIRADFTLWPSFAQSILFGLMLVGGCSGSTAGGIKVIRHVVLFKQSANEIRRLLYPRGVFSIQLNRKVGRKDVVYGVAGFIFVYFTIIGIGTLLTAASGLDLASSIYTAVAFTGNIGSSITTSGVLNSYNDFPNYLKLFYSLVMIMGRLELWTVLVLFTPQYWKA